MKPAILLSGLPKDECRQVLGDSAWAIVEQAWRDPDTLVEGHSAELTNIELVWLYRSPAMELLQAPPLMHAEDILESWARRNRAVMNLRRGKLSRLIAFNIGAVAAGEDLASAWPALAGVLPLEPPAPVAELGLVAAIECLLRWTVPDPYEVYDVLEAVAITSPYLDGVGTDANTDLLLPLVSAVRRGAASAAAVAPPDLQEAERQEIRAENLSLQLQQVREEMDHCYLHARRIEQVLADREADWNEAHALREYANQIQLDEEQLLLQLQGVQEELELHQEGARRQAQALESERKRCVRADGEIRVLRRRLELVLSEMRTRTTRPLHSVSSPGRVQRFCHDFFRRVMSRIKPSWAPAPLPDADRARALSDLGNSCWFDRDWYTKHYADVDAAGFDAVEHYHDHGWSEGRDPSPDFSTRFYLDTYPDVAASKMVPLVHFIRHGLQEGRLPRDP